MNVNDNETFSSDNERYNEIAKENGIYQESETVETTNEVPQGEVVGETSQETKNIDPFQDNSEVPKGETEIEEDLDSNTQSNVTDDLKDLPKGFQKQLKRNKRTIERLKEELEQARKEMTNLRQTPVNERESKNPYENLNITRENFTSDEEYLEFLATKKAQDYLNEQSTLQKEQQRTQEQLNSLTNSWKSKIEQNFTTAEEQQDFVEAMSSMGNPSNVMRKDVVEYIFNHQAGPKLLKYFADRPDAVKKINTMHPYDVVDALKQINNFVTQPKRQPAKPVQPVGGLTNKNPGHNTRSIDEMTDEELLTHYRAGKL